MDYNYEGNSLAFDTMGGWLALDDNMILALYCRMLGEASKLSKFCHMQFYKHYRWFPSCHISIRLWWSWSMKLPNGEVVWLQEVSFALSVWSVELIFLVVLSPISQTSSFISMDTDFILSCRSSTSAQVFTLLWVLALRRRYINMEM